MTRAWPARPQGARGIDGRAGGLLGDGADGGVVLNSPVGGASPDAVIVAARLGGRFVWMPTISSVVHKAAHETPRADRPTRASASAPCRWWSGSGVCCRTGWTCSPRSPPPTSMLASGHLSLDETVAVFAEAHRQGVRRFLVNHPLMHFLGWRDEHADRWRTSTPASRSVCWRTCSSTMARSRTEHLAYCLPARAARVRERPRPRRTIRPCKRASPSGRSASCRCWARTLWPT